MMTVEAIGTGSQEDFSELVALLNWPGSNFKYLDWYDEDCYPTPWNVVVRGEENEILGVLEDLDSKRIYYETTMRLPVS